MIERRILLGIAAGSALLPVAVLGQATPVLELAASVRLNQPGPENDAIGQRAGLWDMTETVWDRSGAPPVTTTGLVAERRVIGAILQEVLRPETDIAGQSIARIDYLTFNRVEGRWNYISMDMRVPVGIMSAWSFERGEPGSIEIAFAPFAIAAGGDHISGQMLRMSQVITVLGPDRDIKEQYFLFADGTGTKWLAHRYEYKRRA